MIVSIGIYNLIGPVIPTAKSYGRSQAPGGPHRRGTIRPPPASPQVQRKKIALQPPILPTLPFTAQHKKIALQPPIQPQTAPAAALRIPYPARVHHIKWQGMSPGSFTCPLLFSIFLFSNTKTFVNFSYEAFGLHVVT